MPTGATVAALTTSLPETPGGERNWDYRYTWMRDTTFTLQALHYLNLRLGGRRVHAVRGRPRGQRGRCAPDHVRDRRPAGPDRVDARPPLGLRGRPARCASATAPSTSARTTSSAPSSTPSCCTPAEASGCPGGCGRSSRSQAECATQVWRNPDQGIWEARGAPQHYVSSKLMCWVALDRAAKLAGIRSDSELEATWRATADEIKADILEHGVTDKGVLRQHYDTDSLDASVLLAAIFGFLAARRRAAARERARHRRGADRERLRPPLPHGRDRRRPLRQGGDLPDLLVLARVRTRDHRRGAAGARPDGAAAPHRVAAGPLRGGVRDQHCPAPRQLPAGLLAPRADRGGRAHRHRRDDGGDYRERCLRRRSSSGAAPGAERSPTASLPPESGSCCWSGVAGSRASRRTGSSQDVFVENRYVSPETWYDASGKPFQPQVHYFVGGATKLYGAALYRLRREDFGELRHHDGISPAWPISYDELEPYYTQAEQLYQVHGARGEDPTEPDASGDYPHPAVSHEPRIQQLSDDLAAAGYHPFHAPCGILLDESNPPYSTCVRCANCDGFPCVLHAKSDAEVIGVRPALEHPNVTLLTDARVVKLETNAAGTEVTGVVVERDGQEETFSGGARRRLLRRGELGEAPARVGERRPSERPRERLRPGRAQLHVPRQPGRARTLARGELDHLPEDPRAERLLLRRATTSSSRWGTSRWSASPRRRCSAARSPSRRSSRRSGRSSGSRGTRSTSGSRPRTCPARTTASRSTVTAR